MKTKKTILILLLLLLMALLGYLLGWLLLERDYKMADPEPITTTPVPAQPQPVAQPTVPKEPVEMPATPEPLAPPETPAELTKETAAGSVTIRALIDGRSRILIREDTVQWQHFEYSAPGKHLNQNLPTMVNGKEWRPNWPATEDDGGNSRKSDLYVGFYPPLPRVTQEITVVPIEARGIVGVVESPNAQNDYTAIIEFNDNPINGSANYWVRIFWGEKDPEETPEIF